MANLAKKNIITDLEDLKTSFMGYDREAVLNYIQLLFDEKDREFNELLGEKMSLVAENAGLKAEIETRDRIRRELVERAESMNESLEKISAYAREREEALEDYKLREKEIDEREVHASERCKEIIKQTNEHADAILKEAEGEREKILARARKHAEELYAETEVKAQELLTQAREKAKEQRDLFYFYKNCMKEYRDQLNILLQEKEIENFSGKGRQ